VSNFMLLSVIVVFFNTDKIYVLPLIGLLLLFILEELPSNQGVTHFES